MSAGRHALSQICIQFGFTIDVLYIIMSSSELYYICIISSSVTPSLRCARTFSSSVRWCERTPWAPRAVSPYCEIHPLFLFGFAVRREMVSKKCDLEFGNEKSICMIRSFTLHLGGHSLIFPRLFERTLRGFELLSVRSFVNPSTWQICKLVRQTKLFILETTARF